ncbi:MAG: glucosaminidase domain-containing protein [Candidatus Dormibacteria bacterium]
MDKTHQLKLRTRSLLISGGVAFLCCTAPLLGPVHATSVTTDQQQVATAKNKAQKADSALQQAQQLLQSTEQQLKELSTEITSLNTTVTQDTVKVDAIELKLQMQEGLLINLTRAAYESGSDSNLIYLLSSSDFNQAMDREVNIANTMQFNESIVHSINAERKQAQDALNEALAAQNQLQMKIEQANTARLVLSAEEEQFARADKSAWNNVAAAQANLAVAQYDQAAAAARQAAAAVPTPAPAPSAPVQHAPNPTPTPTPTPAPTPPPAPAVKITYTPTGNILYMPVSNSVDPFTTLTNLTLPSGEDAATLNAFLQGTALAGLGQYFIEAEQEYHVSARYLLAHAIEESGWGTSKLAVNKHNLFGYEAYDVNPYVDGMTFPSYEACILYVAQQISTNYLTPTGAFYHGPTLLGMNVDYATDPNWAINIANIAESIPLPAPSTTSSSGTQSPSPSPSPTGS